MGKKKLTKYTNSYRSVIIIMYWRRTKEPNMLPPTEGHPHALLVIAINEISLDFVLESRGGLVQVSHVIREPVPLPRSHPAR